MKVIVLTRRNDAFEKNATFAALIKNGKSDYKPVHLYAYLVALEISEGNSDMLRDRYVKRMGFPEIMIDLMQLYRPEEYKDVCLAWSKSWLEQSDKAAKKELPGDSLPESDPKWPVYVSFMKDANTEVILLFWDRVSAEVGVGVHREQARKQRFNLLEAICADCGVEGKDNMLYIHDKEWGEVGNKEVVLKGKSRLPEDVFSKFDYIAYFMHISGGGTLFDNILNLRFGESDLAKMLDRIEGGCKSYVAMQLQAEEESAKILMSDTNG